MFKILKIVSFWGSALVGILIWEMEDLCSWERKIDIWAFAVNERLHTYMWCAGLDGSGSG